MILQNIKGTRAMKKAHAFDRALAKTYNRVGKPHCPGKEPFFFCGHWYYKDYRSSSRLVIQVVKVKLLIDAKHQPCWWVGAKREW